MFASLVYTISCAPNEQAVHSRLNRSRPLGFWRCTKFLARLMDEWLQRAHVPCAAQCNANEKAAHTCRVSSYIFFFFCPHTGQETGSRFCIARGSCSPTQAGVLTHVAADRFVSTCERQPQTSRIEGSFSIFFVRYCTLVPFDRTLFSFSLNNVTAI